MDRLMEWVAHCRTAQDLQLRMRLMEEILSDVRPALHLYLSSRCAPDAVDDVLQLTLVVIAKSIRQFRGHSAGEFWSWCYGIAWRKSADEWRIRSKNKFEPLSEQKLWEAIEASGVGAPRSGAEKLELEEAMSILTRLEPACYQILWERYILGRELSEVGRTRRVSVDAARMKIDRCLLKARKLLTKHS